MTVTAINPATGDSIETYEEMTAGDVREAIHNADAAFQDWRRTPFAHRTALMKKAAQLLRDRSAEYGRLMALEMGKPLAGGISEAEKCAWVCDYYADNAAAFLASETVETDASRSFIAFEPIGVVLAIMPWNFPFWQVFRFATPALMAGNVGVLKHASNVPRCALAIPALLRAAGVPEGVFQTVLVGPDVVAGLIADRRVAAVTLTGSDAAGRRVAESAGHALKKTVMELGGSDPFVVLADADLDAAARTAAAARLVNSGQSCIAAKRFIAVEEIADAFVERFVAEMRTRRMGDPLDRATQVGPQARHDLRDQLHRQVEASVARGARLLLGGEVPGGPGAFYPPTVLVGVSRGMPAFDEETFGPVAAVVRAHDERDAVALANDSAYGLGASLWTADRARAERLAAEIQAGVVVVNGQVRSDPRMPFGGVKDSGWGRELSEFGMREFVNVKSVIVT